MLVLYMIYLESRLTFIYIHTIVYGKTLQKVMGNPSSRQLQTPGKAEKKSLGNTVKRKPDDATGSLTVCLIRF